MTIPLNLNATLEAWKGHPVTIGLLDGSRAPGLLDALITATSVADGRRHDTITGLYLTNKPLGTHPVVRRLIPWHAVAFVDRIDRTEPPT